MVGAQAQRFAGVEQQGAGNDVDLGFTGSCVTVEHTACAGDDADAARGSGGDCDLFKGDVAGGCQ